MVFASRKKKLHVGIVRFPASNCDYDTLNYFQNFGHQAEFIWYKEKKHQPFDLLILPGGFAFGDRVYEKATHHYTINPGEQALSSPVMKIVYDTAKKGIPILGICNGFQILVKAGLLPGKLLQNDSKKFFCDFVECKVIGKSFFSSKALLDKTYQIPVAHGYGKYVVSEKEYHDLKNNGQIFLEYTHLNPNGSVHNIAGVCDSTAKIFGMMPHPERSLLRSDFMGAIETYVTQL